VSGEWQDAIFTQRTYIYGALLVASRYDGVLLVGIVCLLLLVRRKWWLAYEMAIWCLIPVFLFGFFALYKGGYFVPNALILLPAGEWLNFEWLIGLSIAMMLPLMRSQFSGHSFQNLRWIVAALLLIIVPSLLVRNWYAYQTVDQSSRRIYAQEYPIGRFIYRSFRWSSIASDDMGMISYLTDGRHLDLSGLANNKIAKSKNGRFFSLGLINSLSKQDEVRMAIISDSFHHRVPGTWIKTARWEWPASMSFGKKAFDFYALDTGMVRYLKDQLMAYSPFLPPDMIVQYYSNK
jgi:hypothetical protein